MIIMWIEISMEMKIKNAAYDMILVESSSISFSDWCYVRVLLDDLLSTM